MPAELGPAASREEVEGLAEAEATAVVCEGSISNRKSPLGTTGDDAGSTAATGDEEDGIWEEEDVSPVGMMEISKGRSFLGSAGNNSHGHGRLSNWGAAREDPVIDWRKWECLGFGYPRRRS